MTTMPMSSSSSPMGVGRFLMTCPKIVLPEGLPSPFPLGLAAGALPRAFRSASRRMASVRAKASISGAVLSPCRGWAGRVWGAEAGTEGAAGAGASAGVSGSGAAI